MHFFTIWKNCSVGKKNFGELSTYLRWVQASQLETAVRLQFQNCRSVMWECFKYFPSRIHLPVDSTQWRNGIIRISPLTASSSSVVVLGAILEPSSLICDKIVSLLGLLWRRHTTSAALLRWCDDHPKKYMKPLCSHTKSIFWCCACSIVVVIEVSLAFESLGKNTRCTMSPTIVQGTEISDLGTFMSPNIFRLSIFRAEGRVLKYPCWCYLLTNWCTTELS
jgi:hypothetical protein